MKQLLQLLLVLGVAALLCGAPTILLPQAGIPVAFPRVQLPAEPIWLEPLFTIGNYEFPFVNTIPSVILADILLLAMAAAAGTAAGRRLKQYRANPKAVDEEGDDLMVPKGWLNAFEAIIEYLYNLVEQVAGHKWAGKVFPLVATIFLFVLTINWLHFLPGVDSVGIIHCAEPGMKGFEVAELGSTGIYRLAFSDEVGPLGADVTYSEEACEEAHHGRTPEEPILYTIAPFMRTASTDLNVTFALAIISMVSVQIFGVRELGFAYFAKFFNLPALKKGPMGYIDLGASVLEIISEIAKVVSLSLRLFGNLFAGTILLFVMMYLIPVGAPIIFFLLEVFIGLMQAFIFGMLTLVFTALAFVGHGDEHH
ncbi:MAG TPA: F0F1 ATP synthase subunit A [Chloroflexi bacterium]|nr:F0F1 ATP synthase subunit A [Chloroflexota bacterium]